MKNLAYRTWGVRGSPVLVLLHGFLGSSEDWQELAKQLEGLFYLVAVDLPGHGHSLNVRLDPANGFETFNELFRETLSQLDLKQYSMLGYSLGGRLATHFALTHPQRLEKLLLESSHPGLVKEADRQVRRESDGSWAEKFRNNALSDVLQSWYHQPVFADLEHQVRDSLMQDRIATGLEGEKLAGVLEACSLSLQPSCWDGLAKAAFPVHYFFGERDLKFAEVARKLRDLGQTVSALGIDRAGHNIHRQQPEIMASHIRSLFGVEHEKAV
ncbi:MAG: 2-succinyl-6-hydroxy-2,4-cyclohexadiene-1-carboxylate synthase [Endozoicomonas sp.]